MSTNSITPLLLRAMSDPHAIRNLPLSTWDRLLRSARLAGVHRKLATLVDDANLWDHVPEEVHWHLQAECQSATHYQSRIRWELERLATALAEVETPLILLKGAAYLAAGLPAAHGRISTDLDLLVPESAISIVEQRLNQTGWKPKDTSPRDAKYFRRWLHEIPPMRHQHRGIDLDLHHAILPKTDTLQVDSQKLIERSVPAHATSSFRVLCPQDVVLHASAHLFRNGDFTFGLRDLLDIDTLIRHFATQPNFWTDLLDRADELKLQLPCWLACRYLSCYLQTPIPPEARQRLLTFRPNRLLIRLFDRLVPSALFPEDLDGEDRRRERALWLMAHYPLPRFRAMLTPLFWLKRLPVAGN